MASVTVEGDQLVVRLTPTEKVLALHGNLRVPLGAVRSAEVEPHPWRAMRGVRVGTSLPGIAFYGTRRHRGGKDFGAVSRRPVVRVELDDEAPFSRLLVSVTDAEATVAEIHAAAGP
jgi:hypothetical protein